MRISVFSLIVFLIGLVSAQQILGQIKTNAPDDVVRTRTELVQTDVTVMDKRGFFVDDLHLTGEGLNRARSVLTHSLKTR